MKGPKRLGRPQPLGSWIEIGFAKRVWVFLRGLFKIKISQSWPKSVFSFSILSEKMADSGSKVDSIRKWVVDNKLRSVGTFSFVFQSPFDWFVCSSAFSVRIEHPSAFGFPFFLFLIWCFWKTKDAYGLAESRVQWLTTGLGLPWRPALRSYTPGTIPVFLFSLLSNRKTEKTKRSC